MYDIIEKKRDGNELSYDEIDFFINGYDSGNIPDYQAAALLMAIFLRGMNPRETADLTEIMANSGDRIDLSPIKGVKVDKHSTGGVGDKTTLVLGPIVAACGVPVAKMSGRGLGHTGGTIDKLESIPGFRTALDKDEFIKNVREIGISIAGQTGNFVPADKKLYALRDVTATINNIPLIASSIMSKKIAAGADKIVLDVKTGSGAFMKSLDQSIALAKAMVEIGERVGKKVVAIVTEMDIPLGYSIGNSLEVKEAIETLKGRGPKDLETVSFELAANMLELAGVGDIETCRLKVREAINSRAALKKFAELIKRQGGNPDIVENYELFDKPQTTCQLIADTEGYIEAIKTDYLGVASTILGAGRETKESTIDFSAGIVLNKKTGMEVKKGDLLATLYSKREEKVKEALDILKISFRFSKQAPPVKPLILAYVDSKRVHKYADS
jgi:pyrimidine-nucleoside phosphorylase